MRLAWATDIHLDFVHEGTAARFCEEIAAARVERLLLGGDIAVASNLEEWLTFLDDHLEVPIDFVLGNHDYYGGDFDTVRKVAESRSSPTLAWLPRSGVVPLDGSAALVGHGGWGDGRCGDFQGSQVVLTDYVSIIDLVRAGQELPQEPGTPACYPAFFEDKNALAQLLGKLGDEAAETVRPALEDAANRYEQVIFLTHVPPFREACWHEGKISGEDWLPGFTCRAMGDLLLEVAAAHLKCEILVLCGHSHGSGECKPLPNLEVWTQGAKYGMPSFRVIEV
jgi:3',5'-cyclic-AMP phosphodiesterase